MVKHCTFNSSNWLYATPFSPNPWKHAALCFTEDGCASLHFTTGWVTTLISTHLFTKLVISILMNQTLMCPTPCKTELGAFFFPSPTSLASDYISLLLNCYLGRSCVKSLLSAWRMAGSNVSSTALSSEAHLPTIKLWTKPKRVNLATGIIFNKEA